MTRRKPPLQARLRPLALAEVSVLLTSPNGLYPVLGTLQLPMGRIRALAAQSAIRIRHRRLQVAILSPLLHKHCQALHLVFTNGGDTPDTTYLHNLARRYDCCSRISCHWRCTKASRWCHQPRRGRIR